MEAIIIEDEQIAARRLAQMVVELAPEVKIMAQLDSVDSAMDWFSNHPMPQLIFLDIQLNDGYGFDILDTFETHPPVIFTTAFNEYAIRGYKYNGLDYLLKPIVKKELQAALHKFRKTTSNHAPIWETEKIEQLRTLFKKDHKQRFMVKVGNQFKSFDVADIAFFRSNEGLIYLYAHNGKSFPIEYTIDQLEEIMDPIHFFRINRKYMVSVKAVNEIHTYFNSRLLLKVSPKIEEPIIVSRERTGNFKRWLDL